MFQFTHPGGVRQGSLDAVFEAGWFQFTHPGGVRHRNAVNLLRDDLVSIHAPGRGATKLTTILKGSFTGFNSRTREGCDWQYFHGVSPEFSFNSRTREGCDVCGR